MRRGISRLAFVVAVIGCLIPAAVLGQGDDEPVHGTEVWGAVNLLERDMKVEGALFVPDNTPRLRAVMVVVRRGSSPALYEDQALRRAMAKLDTGLLLLTLGHIRQPVERRPWVSQIVRNAAMGGADALTMMLTRMGVDSGREELRDVPLVFWGFSAAGTFGITYAALHPQRTVAFVRYHSHLRDVPIDIDAVARIPALLFAGEADETAGVEDAEALWLRGRQRSAPWTFAIEPGVVHSGAEAVMAANRLLIPWLTAVLSARVGSDRGSVGDASWLANHRTHTAVPHASFEGTQLEASWLPDESSALGWRAVVGPSR